MERTRPNDKRTLADGTAVTISLSECTVPFTVFAEPKSGDTVTITYSNDGGTNYHALAAVTTFYSNTVLSGLTHLKFQRTAGTGTTSTCGVC